MELGTVPRPTKMAERVHRLVAGGEDRGGAGQDPKWDRNKVGDPTAMTSPAAAAYVAGEPEKMKRAVFGRSKK